jgi:hypothetical protein
VPALVHLPFVEAASIPEAKLRDYVLNLDHREGSSKAKFFAETLAITRDDWRHLHDQILDKLPDAYVESIRPKHWSGDGRTHWGIEWEVNVQVDGLNGRSCPVTTCWMVAGSCRPSFTTAYPCSGRRPRLVAVE